MARIDFIQATANARVAIMQARSEEQVGQFDVAAEALRQAEVFLHEAMRQLAAVQQETQESNRS